MYLMHGLRNANHPDDLFYSLMNRNRLQIIATNVITIMYENIKADSTYSS